MNKKRLLLLLLLLSSATSLLAQTALVVHQKSGEVVYFSFSEQPKATYSGTNLVLTTTKTTVEYPIANLLKFTFGDMADGIEDVTDAKADVKIDNDAIIITGTKVSADVSVFNVSGVKVCTKKADADGNAAISTSNLPNGVYVVKSNNVTFKFIKK